MRVGIKELNDLIKKYNNEIDEWIEFFNSDKYRNSILEPVEDNIKFVIENVKKTYNDYIAEIQKAIDVLEVNDNVEQAKKQSIYSSSRRKLRTTSHYRKVSSRSKERTRGRRNTKRPFRKAH